MYYILLNTGTTASISENFCLPQPMLVFDLCLFCANQMVHSLYSINSCNLQNIHFFNQIFFLFCLLYLKIRNAEFVLHKLH